MAANFTVNVAAGLGGVFPADVTNALHGNGAAREVNVAEGRKGREAPMQSYTLKLSPASAASIATPATVAAAPRKSGVRPAQEKDLDQILAMSRVMLADSTMRDVPLHEPKYRAFLRRAMADPDQACLVYEASDGRLDGMMIGYVREHFFSLEKGACDVVLFVRPERRGSFAAARLWSAFKDWAQRAGATTIAFGTLAGIAPERTRRFYTGMGMTEVGSIYLLTPNRPR